MRLFVSKCRYLILISERLHNAYLIPTFLSTFSDIKSKLSNESLRNFSHTNKTQIRHQLIQIAKKKKTSIEKKLRYQSTPTPKRESAEIAHFNQTGFDLSIKTPSGETSSLPIHETTKRYNNTINFQE